MSDFLLGILIVVLSGLIMGTSPWPLKLMRRFQYEHFGFISMLVALIILPWAVTLLICPSPFAAFRQVDWTVYRNANLCTFAWGIAQVLAMLCFVRIGVSLTYGILCSVGAAVGVIVPMIFKASGVFQDAPDLFSTPGMIIMFGTLVMLLGVVFASLAGAGREKSAKKQSAENSTPDSSKSSDQKASGNYAFWLVMVVLAGVLSVGWGFAFTYNQAPVMDALKSHGAAEIPAGIAVWAVALLGAAVPNLLYPALLMTRNNSWKVLASQPGDIVLSVIYGVLFFIPCPLLGLGALLLGPPGAALSWGLVSGTLILGGQILGFASGEWRGVHGKPRTLVYAAIVLLIVAMTIMVCGKSESGKPAQKDETPAVSKTVSCSIDRNRSENAAISIDTSNSINSRGV